MTASPTTLDAALTQLATVAADAGLGPERARAEGEALAATIAESATGAHVDWADQTSGQTAQDFFDAASRGRRWRGTPTALLTELAHTDRSRARRYAEALAAVCTAAARLGAPSQRTLGNAASVASAQLAAVGGATTPPSATEPPTPGSRPQSTNPQSTNPRATNPQATNPQAGGAPSASDRLEAVRTTGQQVLQSLLNHVRESGDRSGIGAANPLDVSGPAGPGAFPGIGSTGIGSTGIGSTAGIADPELLRRLRPDSAEPQSSPDESGEAATPADDRTATAGDPPDETAAPDEEPEEDAPTLDELLAELDALIGLDSVKAEIHRQVAVLRVEKLRSEAGLTQPTITRHLIFTGNPGTGKTTVARLVAGIYRALGLLTQGQLIEVDRSELVAGYLGQTAIKTAEVVESAVGGVLFIDEAYSLAGDQYGTEAVDTLVKETEDHRDDLVVIVAGYPDPMAVFIAQNPGLSSRFRTTIAFEDYTDDELAAIFASMATAADYDLTEDAETRFRSILNTTPRDSTFGNGRFARNCLEGAIGRHAWRLRDVDEPTLAQLRELIADDLEDTPDEPDTDEPELDEADTDAPGTEEPGTEESRTEEPGTGEPDQPVEGTDE